MLSATDPGHLVSSEEGDFEEGGVQAWFLG